MQVFYAPDIEGDEYVLNENESGHCIRVLRMKRGASLYLTDGRGGLYEAEIRDPDPKKCRLAITAVKRSFETRNYRLHLAVSPLKNTDRFEWFLEKSVEIGVDEITPLICSHTEKQKVRIDRMNNIVISAMKQSLKTTLTVLNEPVSFEAFTAIPHPGTKLIAHCSGVTERKKIADSCIPGKEVLILIGPEGDFSEEEIHLAVAAGFEPVHLGQSRLRTETAGVAACCSVYFLNQ
jgi:16S rRNA (uracil1498-N3)-methyltransferase